MSREMLHVNALHFQWQRASAWAFSLHNTRQDVMQACFALEALLSIHISMTLIPWQWPLNTVVPVH